MSFKVLGRNVEPFMGESCEGSNCNFTYTETEFERHVIVIQNVESQQLYLLKLWHSEGQCGSGWCVATWGHKEVEEIDEIPEMEFVANDDGLIGNEFLSDSDKFSNNFFEFDSCGSDDYYPSGFVGVNSSSFSTRDGEVSPEHDSSRGLALLSMMSNF